MNIEDIKVEETQESCECKNCDCENDNTLKDNLNKKDECNKKDDSNKEECESKKEKKNKYKEKAEQLENELVKVKDEYLRARADMENTKRRLAEENIQNRKYASMRLVEDLINPIDMLLKVVSVEQANPEVNNFLIGFKMISTQIFEALKTDGLTQIEALGCTFDPAVHHAVSKEAVEGKEPNIVIEVLQTGYKYKDRILRPAMVKVSE